jgi:hypothetical protein
MIGALKVFTWGGPGLRQMSVGKDGFAVKVKDVLSAGGAGSNDSVLENGRWEVEDICKVITVWLPLRVNEI